MPKLDTCPEIISMALGLKLEQRRPVEAIVRYCKERITTWVRKAGGANSLLEVQEIVCRNLGLTLIEVWSDEDLVGVAKKYIRLGETVFASLSMQLTDSTFATVMRREHASGKAEDRFVAIIDCRTTSKAIRRFFTRWHEIAHILTLVRQMELPFQAFRSRAEGDPIERLMDVIAGEVGFFDDVFQPVLDAEIENAGRLTFDVVARVRDSVCSDASFQATLIACAKRTSTPVIQLEAAKRYKKLEEAQLKSRQSEMFPRSAPEAKLRAYLSIPNPAAKEQGFLVHPNMQVPESSLIYKHFEENLDLETTAAVSGTEEFSNWKCSDGTICGHGKIHIDVRKISGTLIAMLQPES